MDRDAQIVTLHGVLSLGTLAISSSSKVSIEDSPHPTTVQASSGESSTKVLDS